MHLNFLMEVNKYDCVGAQNSLLVSKPVSLLTRLLFGLTAWALGQWTLLVFRVLCKKITHGWVPGPSWWNQLAALLVFNLREKLHLMKDPWQREVMMMKFSEKHWEACVCALVTFVENYCGIHCFEYFSCLVGACHAPGLSCFS